MSDDATIARLALALLACLRAAGQYFTAVPEDEGVIVDGTRSTTRSRSRPVLLVEFYAPWCGHKKLAPEYVKAAAALDSRTRPCGSPRSTRPREELRSGTACAAPTLKLFQRGGGRVGVRRRATAPTSSSSSRGRRAAGDGTHDRGNFEKFKASAGVVVSAFSTTRTRRRPALFSRPPVEDAIAFVSTDVTIGGGESANTAVLLKTFDEGRVLPMTASTTEAELQEFISGHSMPLVIMFSSDKAKTIFRGPIKIHTLVFVDMAESAKVDEILAMLGEVATETRGKVLHIYVPSSEERILDYFGIANERLPQLMLADMSLDDGMKKYRFTGDELTADAVRAFEAAFFEGALLPDLKSEEPAEDDLSEPVKKLVGKTFAKHVLENDKDVLVEFYAPWWDTKASARG